MKHKSFSFYFSVLSLAAFFLFSSCGSKRDIVYFQNADRISESAYNQENIDYGTQIMPNDNLFIMVSSAVNPDAVEIFNVSQINRTGSLTPASLDIFGYLVDQRGNINLPLLGEIHVAGMTKMDAIQSLQKEITKYVADAVVNIRFLNYKVSVLGEVNRPGVYTMSDERISIPEAIALAGDLTIYGERHTVQLIRLENGEKKFHYIDLTSPNLFFSPYYYLHQNDILYISPNKTRAGSSTYNQNLPFLVSLISVTITAIALFIRYK